MAESRVGVPLGGSEGKGKRSRKRKREGYSAFGKGGQSRRPDRQNRYVQSKQNLSRSIALLALSHYYFFSFIFPNIKGKPFGWTSLFAI